MERTRNSPVRLEATIIWSFSRRVQPSSARWSKPELADHALRLGIVVSTERTVAQHAVVARLLATTVLVVDFGDALGSDLTAGRAQGDELVLALDHAVVAGLRIAFAQFAHGLRHRLVECEAKADVLQDDGEENGGIGTAASGLHDARIDRERAVRNDVAALVVRNVAIVDEAQAVRIEGLLVLKNQRQVGAGQAQMPQAAARRVLASSSKIGS